MHKGNAYDGHYYIFVKKPEGWFKFSDHVATQVDEAEVMLTAAGSGDESAYWLVYGQKETVDYKSCIHKKL